MIRRDAEGGWLLITQPHHAAFSGALSASWAAHAIEPRDPVIAGVARHDDGWLAWDQRPGVSEDDGRPLDFPELPLDDHLAIWRRGPERVAADDPYAGLLVSRHGSGLMEHKLSSASDADRAAIERYLGEQEAFRARLAAGLPRAWLGARLEHNVRVLQLLDLLSLILCCRDPEPSGARCAIDEGYAVVARLQAGPAAPPPGPAGFERRLSLEPWPFGEGSPRRFVVPARFVPTARYTPDALAAALAAAEPARAVFEFHPTHLR